MHEVCMHADLRVICVSIFYLCFWAVAYYNTWVTTLIEMASARLLAALGNRLRSGHQRHGSQPQHAQALTCILLPQSCHECSRFLAGLSPGTGPVQHRTRQAGHKSPRLTACMRLPSFCVMNSMQEHGRQPGASNPQLPFKRPHIPSNRDHKALNRDTLGGLGGLWLFMLA